MSAKNIEHAEHRFFIILLMQLKIQISQSNAKGKIRDVASGTWMKVRSDLWISLSALNILHGTGGARRKRLAPVSWLEAIKAHYELPPDLLMLLLPVLSKLREFLRNPRRTSPSSPFYFRINDILSYDCAYQRSL